MTSKHKRKLHETDDSDSDDAGTNRDGTGTSNSNTYTQKFKATWLNEPDLKSWLVKNPANGCARCKLCETDLKGSISQIRRHVDAKKHQVNVRNLKVARPISEMFADTKRQRFDDQVRSAEIKLVACLAEHNLPFSLMDHLPKLIQSAFPDSEIAKSLKCSHSKANYLMKNSIAEEETEIILERLRKTAFSLIIDESTDIEDMQNVVLIARVFEPQTEKVMDVFVTLLDVIDGTAIGLFTSIKDYLEKNNIPLKNVIGFAADNCSVMMGSQSGFISLLKAERPDLYHIGCICHSFQLCASKASEKLPLEVERLVRNICNYVSGSPKRLRELGEFQEFTETKHLKILKLCQTRWLSHEAVVSRILNQWNALILFFQDQGLNHGIKNANSILTAMNDPIFRAYLYFLNFILPVVKHLNVLFQSEGLRIHHLLNSIAKEFKGLCRNFMKKEYLENREAEDIVIEESNFCPLNSLYLGARFDLLVVKGELAYASKTAVQINCRAYLITLCLEIQKRMNFQDPVLKALVALDPCKALSGEIPTIVPLAANFPSLINESELETLNEEWRCLPLYEKEVKKYLTPTAHPDPVKFWAGVQREKREVVDRPLFTVLPQFMLHLLVLPHSSVSCERIFSFMNNLKNKSRNRLKTDSLNALLSTKEHLRRQGKECHEFQPSDKMVASAASAYM